MAWESWMAIDGGLSKIMQKYLAPCDWTRIENMTGAGVPDVNYCIDGCEGWIELKKSYGLKIKMRSAQVGWAERRIRNGGRVFIAVRWVGRGFMLFPGGAGRRLLTERITDVPNLVEYIGGQSAWDWPMIRKILMDKD